MSIPTSTVHNSSVPTYLHLYIFIPVGTVSNSTVPGHSSGQALVSRTWPCSQQFLRIGGWAHVPRVQEVHQLLSCRIQC
jgi:hypothetical protein